MVAFELKTKQDIQDFATGCCFFGCGEKLPHGGKER